MTDALKRVVQSLRSKLSARAPVRFDYTGHDNPQSANTGFAVPVDSDLRDAFLREARESLRRQRLEHENRNETTR